MGGIPVDRNQLLASDLLPSQYSKPGQLRQEYAVDEVLMQALMPVDELINRYPHGPQQMFPQRFGYDHTPLTIQDVLATDRWAPKFRQWMSGAAGFTDRAPEPPFAEAGSRNALPTGQGITV